MTGTVDIPTTLQARHATETVLAAAANDGRRPSVLAVARQLGLSNTTFRRHFPELAREVGQARRTPQDATPESPGAAERDRLVTRNARLRRDNKQLREHLGLAAATIRKLTLTAHHLQAELEAASKVTPISTRARPR